LIAVPTVDAQIQQRLTIHMFDFRGLVVSLRNQGCFSPETAHQLPQKINTIDSP
jgi:hypothetical protein